MHCLEEIEEQPRRKKEQLELETNLAALWTNVSDGMKSYFEKQQENKTLNVKADPFVPQSQGHTHGQIPPIHQHQ